MNIINHTLPLNINDNKNIWIGLNDINEESVYEWHDNTTFDYGNFDNPKSYPPWYCTSCYTDDIKDCFGLESNNLYGWNNKNCDTNYYRAMCNSCDGKLNKFAITPSKYRWSTDSGDLQANDFCASQFGTSLASIHSARDFNEIVNLCQIFVDDPCWIGLNDLERSQNDYIYQDGTEWDFAISIPGENEYWGANLPSSSGNKCIGLWPMNDNQFKLGDAYCDHLKHPICNMPTELCSSDNWNQFGVTGSIFWENCSMLWSNAGSSKIGNIMVINNKQWINNGGRLIIEYMYKMSNVSATNIGQSGIIFRLIDVCNYYFVGFRLDLNGIDKISFGIIQSGIYNELTFKSLIVDMDRYYLLSVQIKNNNTYEIYINDVLQIRYVDDSDANMISYNISGYIGLLNDFTDIHAKSLFASGSVVYVDDNDEINKCPTMHPTVHPTVNPTFYPTAIPTKHTSKGPTISPTMHPTLHPTVHPTVNPTFYTTAIPTKHPSKGPTISPTNNPLTKHKEGSINDISSTKQSDSFENDGSQKNSFLDDNAIIVILVLLVIAMICCCLFITYKVYKQRHKINPINSQQIISSKNETKENDIYSAKSIHLVRITSKSEKMEHLNHNDVDLNDAQNIVRYDDGNIDVVDSEQGINHDHNDDVIIVTTKGNDDFEVIGDDNFKGNTKGNDNKGDASNNGEMHHIFHTMRNAENNEEFEVIDDEDIDPNTAGFVHE